MAKHAALKNDWTRDEIDEQLEGFTIVTVPVEISFKGSQKILNLSQVEEILGNAKLISLEPCTCRQKMKNCDAPVDDVCICVDKGAEEAMSVRQGRKATYDEAMAALRRTHEAGLVHVSFEVEGHFKNAICSCCQCCCHAMSAMTRFGGYDGIVGSSDMIAVLDSSRCVDCGVCVDRCQFDAFRVVADRVRHYPGKCAGCGVCVSFCPEHAIDFVKRPSSPRESKRDGK